MQKLCTVLAIVGLAAPVYAENAAFPQTEKEGRAFLKAELSPPPDCDDESDCVILNESGSIQLSDVGEVRLEKVLEDSRCPIDAVCIWEGRVKVKLSLKSSEACGKQYVEVGIGPGLLPVWKDDETGLTISLQQVWPEKILQIAETPPYQLKVQIRKVKTN